jgi:phage tail-like protein
MSSPPLKANTARADPYRNFRFKVKLDSNYVAAFSKVSGLGHATGMIARRTGGDPGTVRLVPGQSKYDAITLERGITHDTAFAQWANKIWDHHNATDLDPSLSLADFRKNITIELYDEAGQKMLGYNVYRCWASEFTAMPDLDANGNAIAIQSLVLQNEGWQRDDGVTEADEANDPPS